MRDQSGHPPRAAWPSRGEAEIVRLAVTLVKVARDRSLCNAVNDDARDLVAAVRGDVDDRFAPLVTATLPEGEIEPFAPAEAVIVNVVGGITENVAAIVWFAVTLVKV
ncbi:MAG: hypothetical protein IPM02_28070 [Betaproteobacteria bacterium]|nr:hypothetical protein [Betaproteobacteria bacterium]